MVSAASYIGQRVLDAVVVYAEMLPSLDNFVSYGADVFKTRPDYRQKVLDIYETAMTHDNLGDSDRINGCKLVESVLLNLTGHIDDVRMRSSCHPTQLTDVALFPRKHIQNIIKVAIDHIDGGHTYSFKLANLIVLINTVYYNPTASLHLMENYKPGAARLFFDTWFKAINTEDKLPRVHDKKLSLLTLSKLLELDGATIPASLQEGWFGIVGGALVIFKSLPQAISSELFLFSEG